MSIEELRIDKWLWAARFFKTRRAATEACQAGKVKLNSRSVKPSRVLKPGDELLITRQLYKQQVRVVGLQDRRVSAKLVATLYEDRTPEEEIEQARTVRSMEGAFHRARHKAGRPTKRDRRALQKLKGRF